MDRKTEGSSGRDYNAGPGGLGPEEFAAWYRERSLEQWGRLDLGPLSRAARALMQARDEGRKIYVMGNGGSAAIASQWSVDLCKTASREGGKPLRCVSLTDNVPYLTAIGNDIGYDQVFVRQLENLLEKDDLVIVISGSGNSPNVVKAAEYARSKGARTVGLLGFDGGKLKSLVDIPVLVPCDQYGVVEDLHQAMTHILTFYLRQA